jgi:hypothetical protein
MSTPASSTHVLQTSMLGGYLAFRLQISWLVDHSAYTRQAHNVFNA